VLRSSSGSRAVLDLIDRLRGQNRWETEFPTDQPLPVNRWSDSEEKLGLGHRMCQQDQQDNAAKLYKIEVNGTVWPTPDMSSRAGPPRSVSPLPRRVSFRATRRRRTPGDAALLALPIPGLTGDDLDGLVACKYVRTGQRSQSGALRA